MTACIHTLPVCLFLASALSAQSFPDRMSRASEADAALLAKVALRLRAEPARLAELARRQPNLYVTREGEALYFCELPAGVDLGSQNAPQVSAAPTVAAATVGGDTARFVQVSQYSAAQTFKLHSRPGAKRVIYLDFDGHTTPAGTPWGGRIVTPAYDTDGNTASFSGAERGSIQAVWRQVAEDFAPFDIDVTTEEPGAGSLGYSGANDSVWGMRVVIGGSSTDWYKGGAGGVALVGSFQRTNEVPCFVFSKSLFGYNAVAYAASHEVGHTLGLSHDGTTAGVEYYSGHAGWAPIMGAGYGASVVQWSKGDYLLANNTEDDLAVMSQDAPYAAPDIALTQETALTLRRGDTAGGTIARDSDAAWYRIPMTDGAVDIVGEVAAYSPNLRLRLSLLDEAGATVAETTVGAAMGARLQANVAQGTYFLVVEGVGAGDPTISYDGYGSLGRFRISGTWPDNILPIASTAGSTPLAGKAPLSVAFRSDSSLDLTGTIVGWLWDFGDGTATSTEANPTHVYASPGTYTARLTVQDDQGGQSTASVVVTAGLQPVNNRPLGVGSATAQWVATSRTEALARATFRLLDSAGRPMPGVAVTATLEGLETRVLTGVTDRMGYVAFESEGYRTTTRGSLVFTVRSATLAGYAYLPSASKVTSVTLRR